MLEKRNLAKLAVIGVSLAVCTGAAFWDTGGETKALEATQQAVTPVVALAQVYVSGEVVHPGIYQVPKGCRAHEAIQQAGGLTALADKDRVNLARICKDGTHINVPALSKSKLKRRQERAGRRAQGEQVYNGPSGYEEPGISEDSGKNYQSRSKQRGVERQVRKQRPVSQRSDQRQAGKSQGRKSKRGGGR